MNYESAISSAVSPGNHWAPVGIPRERFRMFLLACGGVLLLGVSIWLLYHVLTTAVDPTAVGRNNPDRLSTRIVLVPACVLGIPFFLLGSARLIYLSLASGCAYRIDQVGFTDYMHGWGTIPFSRIRAAVVRQDSYRKIPKISHYVEILVVDPQALLAEKPWWRRWAAELSARAGSGTVTVSAVGAKVTAAQLADAINAGLANYQRHQ